jgi:hypothetical protein
VITGIHARRQSHSDIPSTKSLRSSVVVEVQASPNDIRSFIVTRTRHLLDDPSADEIVEDALPDARTVRGLTAEVMARLRKITTHVT